MSNAFAITTERFPSTRAGLHWIPVVLWLLLMTSMASFRQREGSALFDQGGFDVQVMFQIGTWLGLGALSVYLIAIGRADLRLLKQGPLFWYTCFIAAAFCSLTFSASPSLTAFRAYQHAVALVLVISMRDQLKHVYLLIILYIAVNWLLFLIALSGLHGGLGWLSMSVEGTSLISGDVMNRWRFSTAFGHPSWISILAASAAVGLSWRQRPGDWDWRTAVIGWLALTTVLTVSRTAIAGMLVAFVVVLAARRTLFPWVCLIGFLIPLALMSTDLRDSAANYLMRGQSVTEFQSMTGRVDLYGEALTRIQRSMPFGMGFQSGRIDPLYEDLASMAHAHNFFLEALTGMGVAGGLLVVLIVLSMLHTLWQLVQPESDPGRRSVGWELAVVSIPLAAFCVMDSGFVTSVNQVVLLYVVVMAHAQTTLIDGEPSADAGLPPYANESTA